MSKIIFKINKDGNVLIDKVEGYGAGCLNATEMIERALGKADESTRSFTDEYNEPIQQDNSEQIRH